MKKFLTAMPLLLAAALAPAQAAGQTTRARATGPAHFDTSSRPLRDEVETRRPPVPRGGRPFDPARLPDVGDKETSAPDPLAATTSGPTSAVAADVASSEGTPLDPNRGVSPSDSTGDVGPNHYVQWANLRFAVYALRRDPVTRRITGFDLAPGFPKNGNAVWQGFGGPCETYNDGDPIVQYDQLADRWVLTQFAVTSAPYTQCVAVSTTPDPTGTYHRYSYSYGADFNDYPKMSVWPNGYYITYNMIRSRRAAGSHVCAFERAKMLAGAPARQVCARTPKAYWSLLPADLEGTRQPASPEAALPLMSMHPFSVHYWRYQVNWAAGTGTLTGPATLPVAAFERACIFCIPQPGTTQQLQSMSDRLMYRLSYRNFGTHESLVVNHAVSASGGSGIRWYELRNAPGQTLSTAAPVVHQQGTFAPSGDHRWMGSIAMDKTGGVAVGYNISNATTIRPSIRYAYRAPTDPPGLLGGETQALAGTGSQTSPVNRWGDYSTLAVDPVDDCTMVFTGQFMASDGWAWRTFIHSFRLSTCQ